MAHIPEVVMWKQLSDGQVAILIRCDGDVSTDSWHTYSTAMEPTDLDAEIEKAKLAVGDQHAKTQTVKAHLQSKTGKLAGVLAEAPKI